MTEEQKIYDKLIEFGLGEIPNDENVTMYYPALIDAIMEYASQQRTEGIREGFEAARSNGKVFNGRLIRIALTYPTVKDYLNSK